MRAIFQKIRIQFDEDGNSEIVLTSNRRLQTGVIQLKEIVSKGEELVAEIKQYRIKRSLDANAYLWVLLSKMADVLRTTKDELYLYMLERYGVFTHIIVKPEVVDKVKQEWRTVRELGEVMVNGKTGIQLQCYFGSHSYDSKEFSVLLDGVVSEARELGIETLTSDEITSLKEEWGSEK